MLTSAAPPALAATYSWLAKSGTGDWTTASNWNLNSSYPGASSANFDQTQLQGDLTGTLTVNVDTSVSIAGLFLGDNVASGSTLFPTTVSTTNNSTLTFVASTGTAIFSQVGGNTQGKENLVTPAVFLVAPTLEFRMNLQAGGGINAASRLALSGNISAGSAGNKILRFTPANSASNSAIIDLRGDITNGDGTIGIFYRNDTSASVSNTLKLSGTGNTFTGTIDFRGGRAGSTLEASPASGTFGALGTGRLDLGISGSNATLNLGGSLATVTEVNTINVAGTGPRRIAVTGSGNRILSGTVNQTTTGTLTLACSNSGNLTFSNTIIGTGPITVSSTGSGHVIFSGNNTYTGTTTVSKGTLRVDGNQSAASGAVTVAAGATLAGTGTVGGATTIQTGATLSPGASPGTLTFTQGLTLAAGGNYNWQVYDAAGAAGSAAGWDLVSVGGVLDVAATSADPFKINLWSLSGVGPDVTGDALNFSSATSGTWRIASATGGITNFTADRFQIITGATNGTGGFTNAFTGTFSLAQSGNDLNLVYTGATPPTVITINVASGTQTQTAAGYPLLSGTTPVEKTGAGTVVFDQANTLTAPTTVSQGTLQVATADTLSSSAVTVVAGATLSVGPQVSAVVPTLVNNGLVDVGLGGLTVASGQTAEGIVAAIIAGRTDGTWSGTSGITSSAAATQSERAVGWLNNGDGSFTVAFAAAGDWNVNGVVDFDDVLQFVSANLYDTGLPATWADGDFDYNGVVDFDDVLASVSAGLFDTGPYNMAAGGLALMGGGAGLMGGGIVAVPEPTACGLAAVAAVTLLWVGRRWRRPETK